MFYNELHNGFFKTLHFTFMDCNIQKYWRDHRDNKNIGFADLQSSKITDLICFLGDFVTAGIQYLQSFKIMTLGLATEEYQLPIGDAKHMCVGKFLIYRKE